MISDYLEALLGEPKAYHNTKKGLQANWDCPICGENRARFFVNLDRGVVWCHNCEYAASVITFISDYNKISWADALSVYRGYEGYEAKLPESLEEEIYSRFLSVESPQVKYIFPLPGEYIPMCEANGKYGNEAFKYVKSRGLSADDMIRYNIGYCAEGTYAGRIIMPDYENNELIYWQARSWVPAPKNPVIKKFYKKVLNPSLTKEQVEKGIISVDKSEVISNIDFIREKGIAVLCEGKMDSYTIGDSGGCLHGKHMSDMQLLKLLSNKDKIQDIFIMLDNDAYQNAIVMAERLDKYFPGHTYICKLPEDQDPNSLGKVGCLTAIEDAILYTSFFHIKSRLLNS